MKRIVSWLFIFFVFLEFADNVFSQERSLLDNEEVSFEGLNVDNFYQCLENLPKLMGNFTPVGGKIVKNSKNVSVKGRIVILSYETIPENPPLSAFVSSPIPMHIATSVKKIICSNGHEGRGLQLNISAESRIKTNLSGMDLRLCPVVGSNPLRISTEIYRVNGNVGFGVVPVPDWAVKSFLTKNILSVKEAILKTNNVKQNSLNESILGVTAQPGESLGEDAEDGSTAREIEKLITPINEPPLGSGGTIEK